MCTTLLTKGLTFLLESARIPLVSASQPLAQTNECLRKAPLRRGFAFLVSPAAEYGFYNFLNIS